MDLTPGALGPALKYATAMSARTGCLQSVNLGVSNF